jgi:hypothetical protein
MLEVAPFVSMTCLSPRHFRQARDEGSAVLKAGRIRTAPRRPSHCNTAHAADYQWSLMRSLPQELHFLSQALLSTGTAWSLPTRVLRPASRKDEQTEHFAI